MTSSMTADDQRRAAGARAAEFVQDGMVIGYGTGRAATNALEALAARKVKVKGVPTSVRTEETCKQLGLALTTLDENPQLDLVIDGSDEVDPQGNLLKGGGGAHTREKLVALASKKRIIVIEESKFVQRLGLTRGVPIEVVQFGWKSTMAKINELLPGVARRENWPLSDNGGVILDAPLPEMDVRKLDKELKSICGVIEHGLFVGMAPVVVAGGVTGVTVR